MAKGAPPHGAVIFILVHVAQVFSSKVPFEELKRWNFGTAHSNGEARNLRPSASGSTAIFGSFGKLDTSALKISLL
jgi:hypothetical protein